MEEPPEFPEEQPADDTISWRYAAFKSLGFDIPMAMSLAGNREVDWHRVAVVVEGGCPLDLAVRIFS